MRHAKANGIFLLNGQMHQNTQKLACARGHFVASDMPLLSAYARAITLDETAARMLREQGPVINGKVNPWLTVKEKAHRELVALSMRLRLSPQGRAQHPPQAESKLSWYERMALERDNDEA
jgi:phage terminase small subunit